MNPKNAIGLGIGQDLHATFGLSQSPGPAVGAISTNALFVTYPRFLELLFGLTNRRDLGVGVDDRRNAIVVEVRMNTLHAFHTHYPFFHRFMGKHRSTDDITQSVDTRNLGLEVAVDWNEPSFVRFNSDILKPDVLGQRHPAGSQ